MKRGKDDEKIIGPMFPRLHVNDTEKGGPRAPPRNKMALYEQLSIPSQSFNPGVLPLDPSNTSSLASPSSSSQGSSLERNMLFPSCVSHLTPTNLAEKFHTRQLGGASVKAPLAHLEQRKVRDEDDFMVPVFVNSETDQQHNKTKNGFDGEKLTVPDETNIDSECHGDKTCGSLRWANGDKIDDVSETSMVDSISGLDIFPDDLVGIIGQKHFWKARREIANQQRVFAVQVFELHRLIKVQRLIAGSPHLLLEDTAYLSKPSFKGSPAKKLPPDFIVKPLPHTKHKDDSEKPSHKMECSAENAVARTSVSSVKNGSQPSNYGPFLGNPPPEPVNGEYFHQVPGHQWLVPIMSPSEGLIYKPYPGPGFMGCGGCGPFGRTPMTGNFMTSAYGVPASSHQGIGVLPGAPPVVHSHFPPYGMPVMNPAVTGSAVEQMNQFAGPGSHAHSGQLSGGGAKFNIQHQSSCDLPCEKKGAISHVMKFQASTDTELQGSTASSPGERVQRIGASGAAEGKNALPLLPTASNILEGASQPCDTDQRTRVIRVVPHNPRSATESAARIFQSIQKERTNITQFSLSNKLLLVNDTGLI